MKEERKDNMNCIKNIFSFFEELVTKKDNKKMIKVPVEKTQGQMKSNYMDSLKINVVGASKSRKKVKTLICVGNGLGIQGKIRF